MNVTRIVLKDFRSYESLEIEFGDKTNLILGPNAAGKSNLAEAIYYLSAARSWRSSDDDSLIAEGKESAYIEARIHEGSLRRTVSIEIGKDQKRVRINGKPVARLSELTELVNVLVFSPSDVSLFRDSPSDRRAFLDASLSKQDPRYLKSLSKAHSLLRERNLLLKQENPDRDLLWAYARQLAEVSEIIVRQREAYCESINSVLPMVLEKITGEPSDCRITYKPFLKPGPKFVERAESLYRDKLEDDLFKKSTGIGIHREDFSLRYKGKDVAQYGSQGENRICALALKLAPYYLVKDEARKPICVLDDVASELDAARVANLMKIVQEDLGQTFVTATELRLEGASIVDVADHNATRRN